LSIAGYTIEKEIERFQEKCKSRKSIKESPSIIPKCGIFRSCLYTILFHVWRYQAWLYFRVNPIACFEKRKAVR
jgi:hypothetical protein